MNTYSLMKQWLSSLDRKILDPVVSLLISAISWPQSPSCTASTLRKNSQNETTFEHGDIRVASQSNRSESKDAANKDLERITEV